jgi:hypothetical protein
MQHILASKVTFEPLYYIQYVICNPDDFGLVYSKFFSVWHLCVILVLVFAHAQRIFV